MENDVVVSDERHLLRQDHQRYKWLYYVNKHTTPGQSEVKLRDPFLREVETWKLCRLYGYSGEWFMKKPGDSEDSDDNVGNNLRRKEDEVVEDAVVIEDDEGVVGGEEEAVVDEIVAPSFLAGVEQSVDVVMNDDGPMVRDRADKNEEVKKRQEMKGKAPVQAREKMKVNVETVEEVQDENWALEDVTVTEEEDEKSNEVLGTDEKENE